MDIIFIIGIVQAFFIEFILLNKKNKRLADKILATYMFVVGVHLSLYYLFHIQFYKTYPHILGFMQPFPLLHGPLLLLYIQKLISPAPRMLKKDILHFVPFVLFYAFLVPDMIMLSGEEKIEFVFHQIPVDPPLYVIIFGGLVDASGIVYVIWSLIVLRKHQLNLHDNFSFTENIDLNWLRLLILGLAGVWLVVIATTACNIPLIGSGYDNSVYVYVAATIFVFLIGFFGSRQGSVFTDNAAVDEQHLSKTKYEKSGLSSEKAGEYLTRLEALMLESKPFLQTKITLKDISEQLSIHPNYLSQVINEHLGQNFFDFINNYRVEEFKQRLVDDPERKLTMLAHAYESGFSSKSSFNEVFKKTTGQTPSQWWKRQVTSKT